MKFLMKKHRNDQEADRFGKLVKVKIADDNDLDLA